MGKWIVLFLILLAIYLLVRAARRPPGAKSDTPAIIDSMVACESCGLHLPQADALEIDGRIYCCKEHANSGSR
ncbi:MAG: PP0621 family protein [Burkholderiales bacterium]